MKLRIMKLTPEYLASLLKGNPVALPQNMHDDTEILDIKMDLYTKQISIIIRSDSFSDVAESMPIPELNSKEDSTIEAIPPAPSKIEPQAEGSSFIPKLTKPPISRYASKMENEFSPDQRKLLNFTVKDDCVVVKPVTFLKTEWDEINEVVRSLGGRWIKGDIISYWEIPLQ